MEALGIIPVPADLRRCLQVLSNADLRAKYDAHGVEGLDVNFMDTAEFFSMLFGSESFDHLLGELSLARMTRCGSVPPSSYEGFYLDFTCNWTPSNVSAVFVGCQISVCQRRLLCQQHADSQYWLESFKT